MFSRIWQTKALYITLESIESFQSNWYKKEEKKLYNVNDTTWPMERWADVKEQDGGGAGGGDRTRDPGVTDTHSDTWRSVTE